jgi:hypothetical protein
VTIYLTAEQVLLIDYRLVSETGGEHGVRDIGLLESAIAHPTSNFNGKEFRFGKVYIAFSVAKALSHTMAARTLLLIF